VDPTLIELMKQQEIGTQAEKKNISTLPRGEEKVGGESIITPELIEKGSSAMRDQGEGWT